MVAAFRREHGAGVGIDRFVLDHRLDGVDLPGREQGPAGEVAGEAGVPSATFRPQSAGKAHQASRSKSVATEATFQPCWVNTGHSPGEFAFGLKLTYST